ncbi:hypothetical protein IAT38_003308 [Cryptococcus sp. DSM 104549]
MSHHEVTREDHLDEVDIEEYLRHHPLGSTVDGEGERGEGASTSSAWGAIPVKPAEEGLSGVEDAHGGDEAPPRGYTSGREEVKVEGGVEEKPEPDPAADAEPLDERQCRICFAGAEEQDMMGRLISPCMCSGTMRYVHVECINAWRGTGTHARAYMECPQCHFKYRIRRTGISGLATSRPILLLSTFFLFSTLTLIMGSILHLILYHSPAITRTLFSSSSIRISSSPFDLLDDDFYDGGGVVVIGGSSALAWDIISSAVRTFADIAEGFGELQQALEERLPGPLAVGLFGLFVRFILGLGVLGSMSFVSLLLSLSLFGPLHLANALRGGFLSTWGRRRLARQGARNNGGGMGTVIIILLVLVGAVNTLRQTYGTVGELATRLLKYVETQVLEVNPDEVKREQRPRRERWVWRWVKEGRWRRVDGWREVGARVRVALERWVERMRGQHVHEE